MHSQLEDLSLLACMLSDPNADPQLFSLLEQPRFAAAQIQQMIHPLLFSAARQCHTFIWAEEEMLAFPDAIREDCLRILSEYRCANPPLVSPTALCHYLKTIYPSSRDNWKNQDSEMIPYRYQKEILRMLPRRGIPCSRDESEAAAVILQRHAVSRIRPSLSDLRDRSAAYADRLAHQAVPRLRALV